jgi:hypothetical protein
MASLAKGWAEISTLLVCHGLSPPPPPPCSGSLLSWKGDLLYASCASIPMAVECRKSFWGVGGEKPTAHKEPRGDDCTSKAHYWVIAMTRTSVSVRGVERRSIGGSKIRCAVCNGKGLVLGPLVTSRPSGQKKRWVDVRSLNRNPHTKVMRGTE